MVRAVVLIGVSQAGHLETLQAVHDGVRAMRKWASGQAIDPALIKVITDEKGPVEVSTIKKAIRDLVDLTTVEQLVVYFAGHGVNLSLTEYWLLSGAPEDSNAAVNLAGSVELARFCGIPHVVLISDACRTAADGIQAQAIRGSEIFPNIPEGTVERPVDVFFACALGAPSLELKDPKKAAAGYRAIYTDSLVEALEGLKDVVVEDPEENARLRLIETASDGEPGGLIRPWPLSFHLRADVPERLQSAGVKPELSQTPVARINSRATWLSRVPVPKPAPPPSAGRRTRRKPAGPHEESAFSGAEPAPPPAGPPPSARPEPVGSPPAPPRVGAPPAPPSGAPLSPSPAVPPGLLEISHSMLRSTLAQGHSLAAEFVGAGDGSSFPPAEAQAGASGDLQGSLTRIVESFGPDRLETSCGFKVRGARFVSADSGRAEAEIGGPGARTVLVRSFGEPAANVVVQFDNGTGMLLPALAQHVGSITVEAGEVVNVTYEPARGSPLWPQVEERLGELRSLRALMASSARMGVFRLRGSDGQQLAERIKIGKAPDPTMAVYAAYAFHDRQQSDLIREMSQSLKTRRSLQLFDLALLGGDLARREGAEPGVFPFVPLLTRGWPLMGAHRVTLPGRLENLGDHRVESLWTLFDRRGTELIRSAIREKEIA